MNNLLDRIPEGSRILVIRLRSLGDCVLTTPALALLKAHRPDVRIGVVVEDRFRGILEGNPDIDDLLPPALRVVTGWGSRLTINFHGGTRSMWLTAASRAKIRAGFGHHAYSFLYSAKIPRAQEILGEERRVHTAEHLASAMFWLGVPRTEIPRARLVPTIDAGAPAGRYAVLHPFATREDKTWPFERFLEVARWLRTQAGIEPVLLAGPGDLVPNSGAIRIHRSPEIARTKSLIAGAQLFIGNDSGPAHIAAAFGVPVVVLFGSSDPVTWAPWRTEAQVLRAPSIGAIEVDQVIAATEALKVSA